MFLSPGFNPSCGSDPSSGLTSLVHQWLVIGGGTAGPEASRTAKCFSQYKNKTQFLKKKTQQRDTEVLLFCSSRISVNLLFRRFCQPLYIPFLFSESFYVIKMAAELDFGCVHSPTGTEQEGSKVRGREVMRQEG